MKHQIEETLAKQADGGVIVEIGVGHGNGLKALWYGTSQGRRLHVYGIDPFLPYRDTLGGEYGPACKAETLEAIAPFASYVTLIERKAEDVAPGWTQPIALLWLDLSMPYPALKNIFDLWATFVIPGGVVGITGLEYANLGTRQLYQELIRCGWQAALTDQDKVAVLRKDPPRRGVFYIVSAGDGGRYLREARLSADSVRANLDVETWLFSPDEVNGAGFDHVGRLPARDSTAFWYLDSTRYFNIAVEQLRDYGQLMNLDSDTHVCTPCGDVWHVLNGYDLALGHSASRDATDSAVGCPASFPTPQVGVMLFNNRHVTRALFADWLDYYERYGRIYDNNDEAPLRDALWENRAGVRWMTLAPEYALRFDFGAWVNGKVRILHGREGGISTDRKPLERVCEEINSSSRMRHWHHGLGNL